MVSKIESNTGDLLINGNAFTGGPIESMVITDVDIVMNHHLQETGVTGGAYKKYIMDDMKSIKGKLEEWRPRKS